MQRSKKRKNRNTNKRRSQAYRPAQGKSSAYRSYSQSNRGTGSMYSQQRRRRSQKRRRRNLVRRVLLAVIGFSCLIGAILALHNTNKVEKWEPEGTRDKTSQTDTARARQVDYPDSLRKLMERNPETTQFVYDYAREKNKTHPIDLSGEVKKGAIPTFFQWDERWGYDTYGSDMIAITGCGPTCLSMVTCGVTGDASWSPLRVAEYAEKNGYYAEGSGTAWTMMSRGAEELGLQAKELSLSGSLIHQTLSEGEPIICSMGPGDFTSAGHFIVLTSLNKDGTIRVHDPNSRKNTKKKWRLQRLMNQMQNLWAYTAAETK